MAADQINHIFADVRKLLEQGRRGEAVALIKPLLPPDQAEIFQELPIEYQTRLLKLIEAGAAANILEELDEMEERGIPSEYQTFHYHYKNMIEYYILWQNSGSDDFEFMFSQEDNTTKQLWSTLN